MLKTKEKDQKITPNPEQIHQKKPKNRPKCFTADKSFNVSVMANLPHSLFGSDPPLSSSSLSSGATVPAHPI
jgi:hypothetical protein